MAAIEWSASFITAGLKTSISVLPPFSVSNFTTTDQAPCQAPEPCCSCYLQYLMRPFLQEVQSR